jgi:hypothetical protein
MKLLRILFAVAALAGASGVHARTPVPLVNVQNAPVNTGSGKAIPAEAVRKAIIDGGAAGARKWYPTTSADGKLQLTYRVRSHTVSVHVTNTGTSYSLVYADSINMKYSLEGGTPVIHPFYNNWVNELRTAIDFELRKL